MSCHLFDSSSFSNSHSKRFQNTAFCPDKRAQWGFPAVRGIGHSFIAVPLLLPLSSLVTTRFSRPSDILRHSRCGSLLQKLEPALRVRRSFLHHPTSGAPPYHKSPLVELLIAFPISTAESLYLFPFRYHSFLCSLHRLLLNHSPIRYSFRDCVTSPSFFGRPSTRRHAQIEHIVDSLYP